MVPSFQKHPALWHCPPIVSGYKRKTCAVLKSGLSLRDSLVTHPFARVWGHLAYHLLFHLHIGTNSPSGNPTEEMANCTMRATTGGSEVVHKDGQANGQTAATSCFEDNTWSCCSPLLLLKDAALDDVPMLLQSPGHTPFPPVSLHRPVHGSVNSRCKE